MSARSPRGLIAAVAVALAVPAAPAVAAPPSNDAPTGAAAFSPYTAENGVPTTLQAVAELAEAQPDPDVPRCLGRRSFARTVWYRIPESSFPAELTIEASGQTLDVIDLAAFVQAEIPPPPAPGQPPPPPSAAAPLTREPNACSGVGAGGSDASEEPTAGVTLRVPARHPVLVQVGRRGSAGSPDEERALVTLESQPLDELGTPRGDRAGSRTPRVRPSRRDVVDLVNATLTDEDPAQPPCPSLGSVWRRVVPRQAGKLLISVDGRYASTLTVFAGSRPTGDNVLDCVNREGTGALQMVLRARRRQTVWVRIGTDAVSRGYEEATARVTSGKRVTVIDGGPGGFDPTPRGPAGGFPAACDTADVTRARLTGPRLRGRAGDRNAFRRVPVAIRLRGASVCDAELRLYGPGGDVYARKRAIRVRPGRRTVRLPRLRTFRPGRYRLEMRGVDLLGRRVDVRGTVGGRLTR